MKYHLLKLLAAAFALTLAAFAGLQLNDPDPLVWAGFYAICALVPLLVVCNLYYRPLFWLASLLCLAQLAIASAGAWEYWQHDEALMQSMAADKPYIEEAREFLGSLIALFFISISHVIAGALQKR